MTRVKKINLFGNKSGELILKNNNKQAVLVFTKWPKDIELLEEKEVEVTPHGLWIGMQLLAQIKPNNKIEFLVPTIGELYNANGNSTPISSN